MNETPCTLLLVDDDPAILSIVARIARSIEFTVTVCGSGREALAAVPALRPDAAIVDLRMPGVDGMEVLRALRLADPECSVILMSGQATVDSAVEAIKLGALDYLTKPFSLDRLREALITVREGIRRRERVLLADAALAEQVDFHGMVGRSAQMQDLFDTIRRIAPHVRTVLVTGETGTGKELVARALYQLAVRPVRRFVMVNCAAVVESLFESELFGHTRGAFTGATDHKTGLFEHAHDATLFLDEAGELPLSVQAKLLRAVELGEVQRVGSLQPSKVDVQIVAATNRDLRAEVAAGRFRSDLYYRLSTFEVTIPPLRERQEDIPYLTARFVKDNAARLGRTITGVSTAAERLLMKSAWPGNVRELKSVIERACLFADGRILSDRDIHRAMAGSTEAGAPVPPVSRAIEPAPTPETPPSGVTEPRSLEHAQRAHIQRVLADVGGNKSEAARVLGMSRWTLYRWLERSSDGTQL